MFNAFMTRPDSFLSNASEIITGRLYFLPTDSDPYYSRYFLFNIDDELVYQKFNFDFGPLNLGCIYNYCVKLSNYLRIVSQNKIIVHTCSTSPKKRVNAAFLMGAFIIINLGLRPDEAYQILLSPKYQEFVRYRDVSTNSPEYTISLLDCLNGVYRGMKCKFFDFASFNIQDYIYYEQVDNGDMNWIIPGKFLAFCGPCNGDVIKFDCIQHSPEFYIPLFRHFNITTIIRLNSKVYDSRKFTDYGFNHYELFFPDGTTPSDSIVIKFLDICEHHSGAIAVHCKAGLGRTGTLIAAYIMSHYKFTANEAIAWIRICRSGSVIGPQQSWLADKQNWLWNLYPEENPKLNQRYSLRSRSVSRLPVEYSRISVKEPRKYSDQQTNTIPFYHEHNSSQTLSPQFQVNNFNGSNGSMQRGIPNLFTSLDNITQGDELNQMKLIREKIHKSSLNRTLRNDEQLQQQKPDGMVLRSGFHKSANGNHSISYKRKKKDFHDPAIYNNLPKYPSPVNKPFLSRSVEDLYYNENRDNISVGRASLDHSRAFFPGPTGLYASPNSSGHQKRADLRKQPCVRKIEIRKQNNAVISQMTNEKRIKTQMIEPDYRNSSLKYSGRDNISTDQNIRNSPQQQRAKSSSMERLRALFSRN